MLPTGQSIRCRKVKEEQHGAEPMLCCVVLAGCSGFDWSQDITDPASYRQCYLKQDLPPQNNDTRYVSGVLHHGRGSAEGPIAALADITAAG